MDVRSYNRGAWDRLVSEHDRWTVPVSSEVIAKARTGDWEVVLTPEKPVPREWFPPMSGLRVLGLAAAGGQQSPIFAAAGAKVTVLDNSPGQLGQDRLVADRDGLEIELVEGDMADLSCFADGAFDLIFHPCSNCFVSQVRPVWREAFRVLREGGVLLAGFCSPVMFLFDQQAYDEGELIVRHSIPYSTIDSLGDEEREQLIERGEPLSFGHSFEDQIGGQLDAGFVLEALYEDTWGRPENEPLDRFIASFMATRARRPEATA